MWAKSNPVETLQEHTTEVVKVWVELRKRYSEVMPDDLFWQTSFWAVVYHDFGKICNRFQERIKPNLHISRDNLVRHEFFSGMFLYFNRRAFYEQHIESLIAVFAHHRAFNNDGFIKRISDNITIKYNLSADCIEEFIDFANNLARENEIEPLTFEEQWKFIINKINYRNLLTAFKKGIYEIVNKDNFLQEENRRQYIYHKGILNISDWTASGHLNLEKGKEYKQEDLAQQIIDKLKANGKDDIADNFRFRKFQKESLADNNIIAIAPTGSGKTEASLLWASSKKEWEKIIYLLPTRVTSNAIYTRLIEYFGEGYTQLIHSSARQYIKENQDNSYDQKKYFRDKSFFKNINVCTVDQLLTLGFNLGYWEVKTFHMLNARIIIDEIHLYSPYTLGLIVATIKYLKTYFNTQFYIMTATMPKNLLSLLEKTLDDVRIIKDKELLDQARNRFEVRENLLEESLDEITKAVTEGKKVLLVVNTVDKAIELYEELKEIAQRAGYMAICYHSRFIKIDRSKKEREIFELDDMNDGGILIATQVVEVSLDIDFDILFTENAPIDAIIQRAGRVNRKRKKADSKVIIFQHYEISEIIYDVDNILGDTFNLFSQNDRKRLTERELTNLVDEVYKNMDIENNEKYKEGLNKHSEIQYNYRYIKDLTSDADVFTREGLDTVSIIPDQFEEILSDETDKDIFSNHEVSIRRNWKYKNGKKYKNDFGFEFFKCDYDNEKGLTYIEIDKNRTNTF